MRIFYIFYNDWSKDQVGQLYTLGVEVSIGFDRIEIEETSKNEPILELLKKWQIKKSVGTLYDEVDFDKSYFFVYVGNWPNGYPMPDNDGGYLDLTYDLSNYCTKCGVGKIQKSPFRLRKIPKWGKKAMFELNWIFDEIFVRRDTYEEVFKNNGIQAWSVLLHKDQSVIEDVVQLKIPTFDMPIDLRVQPSEICSVCGRAKYSPQIKGLFPKVPLNAEKMLIFKSREFFGSGGDAHNKIFLAKPLLDDLRKLKNKPKLIPVQPD